MYHWLTTRTMSHLINRFRVQVQTEGQANDNDVRSLRAELKKAEAALKRSKTKDYYKILGVPRECDEHDIKKGYRRESLKHHPDKVRVPLTAHFGKSGNAHQYTPRSPPTRPFSFLQHCIPISSPLYTLLLILLSTVTYIYTYI